MIFWRKWSAQFKIQIQQNRISKYFHLVIEHHNTNLWVGYLFFCLVQSANQNFHQVLAEKYFIKSIQKTNWKSNSDKKHVILFISVLQQKTKKSVSRQQFLRFIEKPSTRVRINNEECFFKEYFLKEGETSHMKRVHIDEPDVQLLEA